MAAPGSSATPEADDLTELHLRRHQAAQAEAERIRAQRSALRLVEAEDADELVEDAVRRKDVTERAAALYRLRTEPPAPPFDAGTLAEVLARPADPPMRVEGLLPWGGSGLMVAQRKAGKTTTLLNFARSLLTGEDFLGSFPVIALPSDASVAFLNYEVSGAQLARWADDVAIPQERFFMVNLRGRRNPLGRPDDRAELAALLRSRNVQSVIVDPFGRAYTGESQNDNGEVQSFLVSLETFVRSEVGALDLMLAAHAGWGGERTRGASALEDWPDTILTLTREDDDEGSDGQGGRRFLKAMGRDVDVDEDEVVMDPSTRVLTRTGNGSRRTQKGDADASRLGVLVVRAVHTGPAGSKAEVARRIMAMDDYTGESLAKGRGDGKLKRAIEYAERLGRIKVDRGHNGTSYVVSETTTSTTSHHLPGGGPRTTSTTVSMEVVGGGGFGGGEHGVESGGGQALKGPEGVKSATTSASTSQAAPEGVTPTTGRRTPIAGGKLLYDHATGQTLDSHTGEVSGS